MSDPLLIDLQQVGELSTRWRERRNLSTEPSWVSTKMLEEAGEIARALVGEYEDRPGRGDLVQEAAQTIIVIASLVNICHPDADLGQSIITELEANGALVAGTEENQ